MPFIKWLLNELSFFDIKKEYFGLISILCEEIESLWYTLVKKVQRREMTVCGRADEAGANSCRGNRGGAGTELEPKIVGRCLLLESECQPTTPERGCAMGKGTTLGEEQNC